MSAFVSKFGVNAAAAAVVAAAAVIPMQVAAEAAPVSSYASQWSQTVNASVSDLATSPVLLTDLATAPPAFCWGSQCLTPTSRVLFSFDFAAVAANIPVVGPWLAQRISKFNFVGCVFGNCVIVGPYGSEA